MASFRLISWTTFVGLLSFYVLADKLQFTICEKIEKNLRQSNDYAMQ
jgi:hypothetical protein